MSPSIRLRFSVVVVPEAFATEGSTRMFWPRTKSMIAFAQWSLSNVLVAERYAEGVGETIPAWIWAHALVPSRPSASRIFAKSGLVRSVALNSMVFQPGGVVVVSQ